MFNKFKDFLWPLGATVLGLFVVPIAIEQYPEVFKDSPWILPVAIAVVCLCWVVPFVVHDRVGRTHGWVLNRFGVRFGWAIVICCVVIVIVVIGTLGYKVYEKHSRHLETRLRALQPSPNKVTESAQPPVHPQAPSAPQTPPSSKTKPSSPTAVPALEGSGMFLFKASPLFTEARKERIVRDFTAFKSYTDHLGLNTTPSRLPIGIGGHGGGYTGIVLSEEKLDDKTEATQAYAEYVVNGMIPIRTTFVDGAAAHTADYMARVTLAPDFATYLNWSFWGGKHDGASGYLAAFWEMRETFGKEFTDLLIAYTIKSFSQDVPTPFDGRLLESGVPHKIPNKLIDLVLLPHLARGDGVVDNNASKMPMIEKILTENGIYVPTKNYEPSTVPRVDIPATTVQNCPGGICAGGDINGSPQVINPPAAVAQVSVIPYGQPNRPNENHGRHWFQNLFQVRVEGALVPRFTIAASHPDKLVSFGCPWNGNGSQSDIRDGIGVCTITNMFGAYTISVVTVNPIEPEDVHVEWKCDGVQCESKN